MLNSAPKDPRSPAPGFSILTSPAFSLLNAYVILALLFMVCGLGVLVYSVVRLIRNIDANGVMIGVVGFALGLILIALGSILYSLVHLVRRVVGAERMREGLASLLTQNLKAATGPGEVLTRDLDRLQAQMQETTRILQDINENTLLDETGRRQKIEFLALQERRRSFDQVDALVKEREWAQARTLLDSLLTRFPNNSEVQSYIHQVDDLRKQAFNDELAQAKKTITDLIAISAWDRAIRHADVLLEKHPDMPAARELQIHVRAERNRFREDQIKRMSGDIQRSIAKKRWNDALQIAKQLMEKYADSSEAEALRAQMKTLENNAEIEKRQELEEQIKDLVRRKNFIQAVELARYVIENYPTSPQATALRSQIEKLEELARQQEKEIQI